MWNEEQVQAVQRMQDYILAHVDAEITLEDLSEAAGYSVWHAARVFRALTGKTPYAYIRALRLTNAAKSLRDGAQKVVDVALDANFDSHDGFTRAFYRQFQILPQAYQQHKPPITYFTHYPVRNAFHISKNERGTNMSETFGNPVLVMPVQRPARKLLFLRAKHAKDYFSYCEEMGCDWEGFFNSIAEKMDTAGLLTLPKGMVAPGTSPYVTGVEVPLSYDKPLPAPYETATLEPCTLLYFQSMPYEDEEAFGEAIDMVQKTVDQFTPERYGYALADDSQPRYNFGANTWEGARMAIPVKKA